MSKGIRDRIVILVLTVMMLAAVASATGFSITDTYIVAGVLVLALTLALSVILEKDMYLYIATIICIAVFFAGFRQIATAFPALSYWSFSTTDNRKIILRLLVPISLAGVALAMTSDIALCVVALILISAYLSFSTRSETEERNKLIKEYDDAREEMHRERRRRRSAIDRNENDIYLATLEERNRIAREIHDNVGHILTRAVVQMKAIMVMNKDKKLTPYLESVDESVNTAMTSIRKSVHELHDDSIDLSLGLNELVKELDGRFDATLTTSIESPTSSEFKKAVLGIVKEALTNVSKYSKGDKVKVEVIENNTFWRIYVHDNGRNETKDYMSDTYDESGIGIENITRRAQSLKGTARIRSDEKGFNVLVTIPKEEKDD
ncbi:MAG: GHKL domain-containing protein [Clostridiales bacterium]|nr:GHKL domain-containing protein [Clostridiales bacterium]